jgi:two-component system, cell cycle response regulator
MDGFEVCRQLKSDPETFHIPVVMVTALDQPSDRLRGLDAGADDFLTKPIDEMQLIARVKSLARLKEIIDEHRSRAMLSRDLGFGDPLQVAATETGLEGHVLLVDDRPSSAERLCASLSQRYTVVNEPDPQQALFRCAEETFDIVIVSLGLQNFDGLRLVSQLRALERTRHTAILTIVDPEDRPRILRGLELGVNDVLVRPVDRNELLARARTQIRNKRFGDRLRSTILSSMELAVLDPLTGLHNRRYLDRQFHPIFEESQRDQKPMSLMLLDIDRFKSVNDTYGHEAGDEVLRAFAKRIRSCVRGEDIVARFGGEEIVVIAPETPLETAQRIAERIRSKVETEPFAIHRGMRQIPVTVSIGVAQISSSDMTSEDLMRRADEALYKAKSDGRNRVIASAA